MTYLPKKYKIESVKNYTKDVKLFTLKKNMNIMPGQFFEVSIPGFGECPLASCSYEKNKMHILIRNAGGLTNEIFKKNKGDFLFIRGPYGKGFPIKELEGKNLIMIAGGTGIAPITSLIDYVSKNKSKFGKIRIYFGFRDKENILLNEKIKKWEKEFDLTISLDRNCKKWKGHVGLICQSIKPKNLDKNNTYAFLCGPEGLMKAGTKELNNLGIKNNKIFWSMERRMECAFGNCGRCLIQDVYVCKDGPVFRYDFIKPRLDNENKSNEVKN